MNLNEFQIEAVEHFEGPCLVTAVPGCGKTRVLVERTIRLIEKGVDPNKILCITFTNKAGKEMKERITNRLGVKPNFFVGTFHSFCSSLLRKIAKHVNYPTDFTIVDDKDQIDLIKQIARRNEFDIKLSDAYFIAKAVNEFRDKLEDEGYIDEVLKNDYNLVKVAYDYLDRIKDNHEVDFAGLIYDVIKLLEANDTVRMKIQDHFKFIQIDEVQDTNYSQFHLTNLLGARWNNIMAIGDSDQSIYRWRGARYQNVLDFLSIYNNCHHVILLQNYRSTPQILEKAGSLIKHNPHKIPLELLTDNQSGEDVKVRSFFDQNEEASWFADTVKKLKEEGGWNYEDIAVLYRMNKMSEPLEQELVSNGVPYEVIGSRSFYDRKEIRDCLSMLKLASNRRDSVSFHRISSIIKGIGNITIGKIENYAYEESLDLIEASRQFGKKTNSVKIKDGLKKIVDMYDSIKSGHEVAEILSDLVDKFEYLQHLDDNYDNDSASNRRENVMQMIDSAGNSVDNNISLSEYLSNISLLSDSDKEIKEGKVSLMSIHAAKGLEFPVVFVIGVEKGILPHMMSANEGKEGTEEERRLLYVAMTRAEKLLYLSYCEKRKRFGKKGVFYVTTGPSDFLKEAGLIKKEKPKKKIKYV